ncbi:MAG: diaminopimelate decarboxylase [Candidatus Margulisbacteria bacterium]|nr:diaminopimelate decarboxylase [Candidatus Margulisiibacteriota bacterium]
MNLPITARVNKMNHLEIGGCDTVGLAKEFGTPLYVMDEATLREKCREYAQSFRAHYPDTRIVFASKALSCTAVLKVIDSEGVGVDVSSGGELYTARLAACGMKNIYYHGNNKSRAELKEAVDAGVGRIVVDNLAELERLDEIAGHAKKEVDILFRMNPGIEAHTHEFIQTGKIDSKFGIQRQDIIEAVRVANEKKYVNFVGIHSHIGSQIFDIEPFEAEVDVLCQTAKDILDQTRTEVMELNLGGGLGISYLGDEKVPGTGEFAERICKRLMARIKELSLPAPRLILEPGRSLVGNAGVTLYEIGVIKDIPGVRKYIMIDGGMADNPRPILYDAKYAAYVANKFNEDNGAKERVTVAGRFCESGDVILRDVELKKVEVGDVLAVTATGAYNYSMASNYNRVCRPAMVMLNQGQAYEIIRRENYEDITRMDVVIS